jgi:polyisoprenyl-phosphate glycosyltransferase
MTNTKLLKSEISRFLLVGSTSVLIDFIIYLFLLIILELETEISKGIGFSGGALFAYFANKNYTFNSSKKGFFAFLLFFSLYITTLFVNIVTNELGLLFLGEGGLGIGLSLFIATGLSALLNFIGMKYLVFRGN